MIVKIINTSVANIRSLQAAFDRLNISWELTESAAEIVSASHVVLPGVGAFAAGVETLDRLQLRDGLLERVAQDRPLLCICLGMQLLAKSSEEAADCCGLGIIDRQVTRFPATVKVPQLGWNDVTPMTDARFPAGQAYFANSYRLAWDPHLDGANGSPPSLAGWGYAISEYGGEFISSLWRGNLLACQFHPELSGVWGENVLAGWLKG